MSEEYDQPIVHEPVSEPQPHPIDALVERWWEDHFPGTAVVRDTASWNVAHEAKEKLKHLLRSKI